MRADDPRQVFLDTAFLLPFFQVNITAEAFTIADFELFVDKTSKIHLSELSVYEAKAKIHRLAKRNEAFSRGLDEFGDNLMILKEDKKFVFHSFSKAADQYFNLLNKTVPELNSFDVIILSQAYDVGFLLTEDDELLALRRTENFRKNTALSKLIIKRWREIT